TGTACSRAWVARKAASYPAPAIHGEPSSPPPMPDRTDRRAVGAPRADMRQRRSPPRRTRSLQRQERSALECFQSTWTPFRARYGNAADGSRTAGIFLLKTQPCTINLIEIHM